MTNTEKVKQLNDIFELEEKLAAARSAALATGVVVSSTVGRPRTVSNGVQIGVVIPIAHREALIEIARKRGVSMSSLARRVIADFVLSQLEPAEEPKAEAQKAKPKRSARKF